MNRYLHHLLNDISSAKKSDAKQYDRFSPSSFEDEMDEIEQYISGDAEQPLSYFTGLKKDQFPSKERLSENEIVKILNAFEQMLETWNAVVDFPDSMTNSDRYEFLRNNILDEAFTPFSFGCLHLDFCSGYPPHCPWGEHCKCLD